MSRLLPGLSLIIVIAIGSIVVANQPFFKDQLHMGPLLLVILVGMAVRSIVPLPESLQPGIEFAQKPIMRLAVAGLGFKLTLQKLWSVGQPSLIIVFVTTVAGLAAGYWICKRIGLTSKFSMLLSIGGGICGASAIVAADSVVQAKKSEVAFSLAIITLLGTVGIVLYPAIGHMLHLNSLTYAVWDGASLHEMAQVVAAGDTYGVAGVTEAATAVKLFRICLLAPTVFGLAWYLRSSSQDAGEAKVAAVPWFLVAFLIAAALASTGWLTDGTTKALQTVDLWLMCAGMAGVGLQSGFSDLKAAGIRPILAGVLQWVLLASISLGLAKLVLP